MGSETHTGYASSVHIYVRTIQVTSLLSGFHANVSLLRRVNDSEAQIGTDRLSDLQCWRRHEAFARLVPTDNVDTILIGTLEETLQSYIYLAYGYMSSLR